MSFIVQGTIRIIDWIWLLRAEINSKAMTEKQIRKLVQMLVGFELIADSMEDFESFKYFKEVKANGHWFRETKACSEKMLEKIMSDYPNGAQLEAAQMPGVVMAVADTLIRSYCNNKAKQFTIELSALVSRYEQKKLKTNPDMLRELYLRSGATNYHDFEKGVIEALKMVSQYG